MADNILHS